MITRPCYCTSDDVRAALDVRSTAYRRSQLERAVESASADAESLLNRERFYPEYQTLRFDWPNHQYAAPWRLWLDEHDVLSLTSLTSGGVALTEGTDYLLRPEEGPPYDHIEILLSSTSSFQTGDTAQQSIVAVGLFGYDNNLSSVALTTGDLTSTDTTVGVDDSSDLGVGDLLTIGTERMLVTAKGASDTGVNIAADLLASDADDGVSVADGTAFSEGEAIIIGTERMLIEEITGNTLTVLRAWDGSTLAAHTTGDDIYARRSLTVTRGATGSTAATHSSGDTVYRQVYPPLLRTLALAEAINQLEQESSAYARTVGSGDHVRNASGAGLAGIRARAVEALGRQSRVGSI